MLAGVGVQRVEEAVDACGQGQRGPPSNISGLHAVFALYLASSNEMEPIAIGLAAACLGMVARINLLHSPRCAKLFLGISVLPSFIFSLYEMAREVQASQMA